MIRIINKIKANQAIKIICLFIVFISVTTMLQAQPPDMGGDPNSAPVDGGLSLLIAGGVGYGIKKMRVNRKNK